MGEVLAELEHALRSNEKESLTLEEELVLQRCKARAVNTFLASAGISSALVWGVTRNRFNLLAKGSFSIGAALFLGGWAFDRSLNSSVQRILAAQGTRMQRELSKIVMIKNLENPASPASKIFYPERVYDDSTLDKPSIRWRTRNLYEYAVADSLQDAPTSASPPNSEAREQNVAMKNNNSQRNPNICNTAWLGDMIADPLECILGNTEAGEENAHAAMVGRREPRARGRRRRRHHARLEQNYSEHGSPNVLTA